MDTPNKPGFPFKKNEPQVGDDGLIRPKDDSPRRFEYHTPYTPAPCVGDNGMLDQNGNPIKDYKEN